ncbi:hypothetical protein ACLB2K_023393 [Fragaria x ananassa]
MGVLAIYSCDGTVSCCRVQHVWTSSSIFRFLKNLVSCRISSRCKKLLQEEEHNNISGEVVSLLNCLSLAMLNVSHNNLARDILTCDNFLKFS